MAAEARRGCGYRKIGGVYLVGGRIGVACDRLPYELEICPCCGHAIAKQSRGWTWVDVNKLVQGPHYAHGIREGHLCAEAKDQSCTFCASPELMKKAGLIWIGEQYYKTPGEFIAEGVSQGFSRRVAAVPRGFEVGKTYVLLAHSKAVRKMVPDLQPGMLVPVERMDYAPGIFYIWLPQRIEQICKESERGTEAIAALEKRGIHPVFVPDNDPDHQPSRKGGATAEAEDGMLIEEEA